MQLPRRQLNTTPEIVEPGCVPRLELFVETMNGHEVPCLSYADGEVFRIGTHRTNELVIDDPLVSQFHCKLRVVQGAWRVEDLTSTNGTRIDGVRIRDADLPLPFCRI